MKTTNGLAAVMIILGVSGMVFTAQAVNPPPDGAYPNFTTAEGLRALQSLTTGVANTAAGWYSLFSNTDGSYNTAFGAGTLLFNVGDRSSEQGIQNTAIGAAALLLNSTGALNTAVGASALVNDVAGGGNTAVGAQALLNNTSGDNLSGANTAVGAYALYTNTTSGANTGIGYAALASVVDQGANTAVGDLAGYHISGGGNIAMGFRAGYNLSSGNSNICIGNDLRGVAGESNTIRIGSNLPADTGASACYIGGIFNQAIDPGTAVQVAVDSGGKLGVITSARRFKRDIEAIDDASEAILALKPVTFHYKSDAKNTPCFGLIAEEVADVNPDLVVSDKDGKPYTVRYEQVNAMLLNEFLKEHRKVEKLEATVAELSSKLERVAARIENE